MSDANEIVARRWHEILVSGRPWPDGLPLADSYRFTGPPMSFTDRDAFLVSMREGGPQWLTGGGPAEVLAQYGDGEWYTIVFTFHSASSNHRLPATLTSHVVDGEVVEDLFAYDQRIAYELLDDFAAFLEERLGGVEGASYGLS